MSISEAIKILKKEQHHIELHLQFKDKAPEYYKELQNSADALNIAIVCMTFFVLADPNSES